MVTAPLAVTALTATDLGSFGALGVPELTVVEADEAAPFPQSFLATTVNV
jgi:hypothetical protein